MQDLIMSESKDSGDWGRRSICETQMYSNGCLIIAITILDKGNTIQKIRGEMKLSKNEIYTDFLTFFWDGEREKGNSHLLRFYF